jgi:hypothetical protein
MSLREDTYLNLKINEKALEKTFTAQQRNRKFSIKRHLH